MEQQRARAAAAAANQTAGAEGAGGAPTGPDDSMDPATFFQTLTPSLRNQLLSELEESQLTALPPELAAEAASLRRDMEERHRQYVEQRILNHPSAALSSLLRHPNVFSSSGSGRYGGSSGGRGVALASTQGRHGGHIRGPTGLACRGGPAGARFTAWPWHRGTSGAGQNAIGAGPGGGGSAASQPMRVRSRQLLDYEGLACLLILLFVDDSKLNVNRLHRVLRNLCYHVPTRDWIINSLLAVLQAAQGIPAAVLPPPTAAAVAGSKRDRKSNAIVSTTSPPPRKFFIKF